MTTPLRLHVRPRGAGGEVEFELLLDVPSDLNYVGPAVDLIAERCRHGALSPRRVEFNLRTALAEALANAIAYGNRQDPSRVVRDGNIVTGGGVTAGIDFALSLVAELAGAETAQAIQLGIEYAPAPPFNAGSPEIAPPEILARATARYAAGAAQRRAAVEAAAARMTAAGF